MSATVPREAFDVTDPDHNAWVEQTGKCLAVQCDEHHEHDWTRCPTCPNQGQPCPCSGGACSKCEVRQS